MTAPTIERPTFDVEIKNIDARTSEATEMFGGRTPVAAASSAALLKHYGPDKYGEYLLEAHNFVQSIVRGRRPLHAFTEAMSSDLFPLLFGDILDRQLYGAYTAAPTTWRNYCKREMVNDFREVARFATSGMRGLLKPVKELAPHERRTMDEKVYKYRLRKYEAGFGISFETAINDDLDALGRLPLDLAQSAIDTEEWFASTLWLDENGLRADIFTEDNQNRLPNNPPLTRNSLQAAATELMKRKDEKGNPITVTAIELVVGPGQTLNAAEILNATEYRTTDADGNVTITTGNGIALNVRTNTNFWLPAVVTEGDVADTMWALFANPTSSARPALTVGFLRGYESPALYEKIPNMRRIGGGAEVPWSFEFGDQEKKVQHFLGGTFVDERMVIGSDGTGQP